MRPLRTRLRDLAAALAVVALGTMVASPPAQALSTGAITGLGAAPQGVLAQRVGITSTVVAKPGSTGSVVTAIQNNLIVLGHLSPGLATGSYGTATTTAVKAFQAAYKLRITGVMTSRDAYVLRIKADAKRRTLAIDSRCFTGRVLCINRTTKKMYWMVSGSVVRAYDVRTGRPGYETRLGSFTVYHKSEKSWSYLYNVWMPYSMYFDGGIAVHYSQEFDTYGYLLGSHGCVNMNSLSDAAWLYSQVRLGERVIVHA